MIIGLTGGTGTGKTMISQIFAENGFEIINYDKVTREIYTPGSSCLNEIVSFFGTPILNTDGTLNRRALGEIVFCDRNALDTLNKIVYKYILSYTEDVIDKFSDKKLLLDAPTLFEAGLHKKCDKIIGVIADKSLRIARVSQRDKLSDKMVIERINSQKSDRFYRDNCDFIIENNGTEAELRLCVMSVIKQLAAGDLSDG